MKARKLRSAHTLEYKVQATRLYNTVIGLAATAHKLGLADQTLHSWIKIKLLQPIILKPIPPLSLADSADPTPLCYQSAF